MATIKFFDNYSSTLSSGYTSGATTLVVTSAGSGASTLATTGDFYLAVSTGGVVEIFKVTARSGTTLTVAGAQAGTTAANHSSSDAVYGPILTKAMFDQLRIDQSREMTWSTFAALASTEYQQGDRIHITDSVYDIVRGASSWSYYFGGYKLEAPPLSSWSWDNQGSSTIDQTYGFEYAHFATSASQGIRVRYRTAVAAPYEYVFTILPDMYAGTISSPLGLFVGFRDASAKLTGYLFYYDGSFHLAHYKWNSTTSLGASYKDVNGLMLSTTLYAAKPLFLKIADDNTNIILSYSIDKRNWIVFDTQVRTAFLASGPTQIAYGGYASAGVGASNVSLIGLEQF